MESWRSGAGGCCPWRPSPSPALSELCPMEKATRWPRLLITKPQRRKPAMNPMISARASRHSARNAKPCSTAGKLGRHMIATESAIETLKFYVNGKWEMAGVRPLHDIHNPATGRVIARVPYATSDDIDRIARSAHEAFLNWRDVPVVDRVQVLYRYKDLLEKHAEDLAHTLTSENGKTLDDSRAEIRRA